MSNQKVKSIKWRRYTRTPYASFQSLHREVNIGVLTVAMLSSVGLKAQHKTLDEVVVSASRVPLEAEKEPRLVTVLSAADIAAAAVHSVPDLLEYAAGIDVRQRGEFGVQTDISVRGGTFDQITILLNGVNISSPQTGHHSADFPVSVQDILRIEILEGPSARVFGTSAFTGVINIVTRQSEDGGEVSINGGSYGFAGGDLRLSRSFNKKKEKETAWNLHNSISGGYSRSDGATPNSDFSLARTFYQGNFKKNETKIDAQFGYSYKQYGANTFYGAASTDQWESNERYICSLSYIDKFGEHLHLSASVNWNRWFDHYQWHKDNPLGENFHRVDALGGTLNLWIDSRLGKTSFGLETRYEGIYSTKLGEPLDEDKWKPTGGHDATNEIKYKNHADRTDYSAFIEHDILLRDWTISMGVLANNNTALDTKWRFYPGVDVSFRPNHEWRLYASWNMALRMPTFTDLYYSGTNIVGTRDIKPEKTNDVCLGTRFRKRGWKAEASVFYSHKHDMIDWVIYANEPDQQTFRSGNFSLDNVGGEFLLDFLPKELSSAVSIRKVSLQYAYINENICYDRQILSSKYAMEYLRHKVVIQGESNLWKNLDLSASWRWQDREGKYNKPYSLLDAKLIRKESKYSIFVECNNILDKTYFDYSYIPQPGRWLKVGANFVF